MRLLRLLPLAVLAVPLAGCNEEPAPSRRAIARYGVPDEAPGEKVSPLTIADPVAAPVAPAVPAGGPVTPPVVPAGGPASPPGGSSKYTETEVKDGGRIVGTVKLKEAVDLGAHVVKVSKDEEKCGHGGSHPSERIEYDPATLGLKNAVISLVDITQGKAWTGPMAEKKRAAQVDQKNCKYAPHVQVVRTDTQLQILNSDPAEHNIHAYRNRLGTEQFNFGTAAGTNNLKAAAAFLKKDAMYILRCDIHPWMNATVFASTHPYVVVTDEHGKFVLEGVPPGTYQIRCWHEGFKATPVPAPDGSIAGYNYSPDFEQIKTVTVTANGEVTVDFEIDAR